MTYLGRGFAKTQLQRDRKAALLASIRADLCEPSHGMTKDEAITILSQDIADYDQILARFGGDRQREERAESRVRAETWHEERDRLVQLIQAVESGSVTYIDRDGSRELQAISPEIIAGLKKRLGQLNFRLDDG